MKKNMQQRKCSCKVFTWSAAVAKAALIIKRGHKIVVMFTPNICYNSTLTFALCCVYLFGIY